MNFSYKNSWIVCSQEVSLNCDIYIAAVKIYLFFTTGYCNSGRRLDGKTAIVTGANTGKLIQFLQPNKYRKWKHCHYHYQTAKRPLKATISFYLIHLFAVCQLFVKTNFNPWSPFAFSWLILLSEAILLNWRYICKQPYPLHKNRKRKGNSNQKKEEISGRKAHTNICKLNLNVLMITDVFLDEKRV